MKELRKLTPEEFERAAERLRHPRPGSKIEAAKKFGVDLTVLIENLRLSPAERAQQMHDVILAAEQVRGAALRARRDLVRE
jgi:hypothetical protein